MKVTAVIPARYASTRFPAKLLQDLGGKTVIRRTYDATINMGLFDDVFVVTDSELIFKEIVDNGGKAVMSIREHESGSDRIAEAVADMQTDIVVNVQGDEPFMQREPLEKLLEVFKTDIEKKVDLASLMRHITDETEIQNPNNVKVVVDQNQLALYFSRSPIPYNREKQTSVRYFQHIGVYAFRKQAILDFASWPVSELESSEKLEQLRYLEHGKKIKMVETKHISIGIDTPEDLQLAKNYLKR